MPRTDARSNSPRTAGRVTPLNAATLLLLVTMVLASSPAAPPAAFVHPTETRPVSTESVSVERNTDWLTQRRRVRAQEHELAAAWWRGDSVAAPVDHRLAPDRAARPVSPADRLIRPALIDLPPPSVC